MHAHVILLSAILQISLRLITFIHGGRFLTRCIRLHIQIYPMCYNIRYNTRLVVCMRSIRVFTCFSSLFIISGWHKLLLNSAFFSCQFICKHLLSFKYQSQNCLLHEPNLNYTYYMQEAFTCAYTQLQRLTLSFCYSFVLFPIIVLCCSDWILGLAKVAQK